MICTRNDSPKGFYNRMEEDIKYDSSASAIVLEATRGTGEGAWTKSLGFTKSDLFYFHGIDEHKIKNTPYDSGTKVYWYAKIV